jgi:hypothetical protein
MREARNQREAGRIYVLRLRGLFIPPRKLKLHVAPKHRLNFKRTALRYISEDRTLHTLHVLLP